jgi:SAM-dependent methyltransferase
MPERRSAFDIAEGFQLAHALDALRKLGLLGAMKTPATADELARAAGVDADMLRGLLEYLAARTSLLRRIGDRFATTAHYSPAADFLLGQYVGAYGRSAARLATTLRDPTRAAGSVDRAAHARAFESAAGAVSGPVSAIARQLELDRLLDLGCGPAALLIDLARNDEDFVGWGVEANRAMCRAARGRIRSAGLQSRLRVLEGDGFELDRWLPESVREAVAAVSACDLVNGFSSRGGGLIVDWLRRLGALLPGRPMVIADYYGRLGTRKRGASPETLLHDYAQVISGQGVPPADVAAWQAIYAEAGCRLAHVIEDRATTRFVHILQLSPAAA